MGYNGIYNKNVMGKSIPSGKRLQAANWKITTFNRSINYNWAIYFP
jgi:hypothetical protein